MLRVLWFMIFTFYLIPVCCLNTIIVGRHKHISFNLSSIFWKYHQHVWLMSRVVVKQINSKIYLISALSMQYLGAIAWWGHGKTLMNAELPQFLLCKGVNWNLIKMDGASSCWILCWHNRRHAVGVSGPCMLHVF